MNPPTDLPQSPNETAIVIQIRANAALVVESFAPLTDFTFGLDSRSVEWLDGYINRIRTGEWSEDEIDQMVSNLGSYLGEAIIAAYGGAWAQDEHGWHIRFDERNRAYPFAKMAKQLKNGPEDSIFGFYSAIGAAFRK
ncbi:MAG: hypothetical protein ABR957_04320 [Terracidiphilus sp.]|jgi:hypothetical protein